jgi:hypothetical protein
MAAILGELYDALKAAGVPDDKARKAAEEVAGYENKLTRLTTLVQISLGVLVILLTSQAALWSELGQVKGSIDHMDAQIAVIAHTLGGAR